MRTPNQNSRPGRPPVLDDEKRKMILGVLAVGGSRSMAARYVGCAVETIARTARRDPRFGKIIRKAEVESDVHCLTSLSKAVEDSRQWRAATWSLTRRLPQRFGRQPVRKVALRRFRRQLAELRTLMLRAAPSVADRRRLSTRIKRLERSASLLAGLKVPQRRSGSSSIAAPARDSTGTRFVSGSAMKNTNDKIGVEKAKNSAEKPCLPPVHEQFRRFVGAPHDSDNGHAKNGKSPEKTRHPRGNGALPRPVLR